MMLILSLVTFCLDPISVSRVIHCKEMRRAGQPNAARRRAFSKSMLTQLADSSLEGRSSELLEGVDLASSVSVSEVDTVVLGAGGISLGDFLDSDDLTLAVLELVESLVELPRSKRATRTGTWRSSRSWRRL